MDHAPDGLAADGVAALRHHGDVDAEPGLLDFAVNVQGAGPPAWLRDRLAATLDGLGRYPAAAHDALARETVAARHGRSPDDVLVLAGSPAEADLVVVGNPTTPTGVLHPAADVRAMAAPGRVLLVDEAFADAIPGEPESPAGDGEGPGPLGLRS